MKKIALAAVVTAVMTGSALAADIYVPPVAPPAPPPAPVFSWEGSYAGVYAGLSLGTYGGVFGGGVTVGHNFVRGSLVYGIDGGFGYVGYTAGTFYVEVDGRIGTAVGATDRTLIYAEAGVAYPGGGPFILLAGAGVEFAINDRISVYGEAKGLFANSITGFGLITPLVRGGVNFHF
jgi:outer membrane immunogenic protein